MTSFAIIITLITLGFYQFLSINVSAARDTYKIKAPAVTGNVNFERIYRTHLNFLENMVIFLPLVLILGVKIPNNMFYMVFSILWLAFKIIFSFCYMKNLPFKIKLGFNIGATISTVALFILVITTLF